MPRGLLGVGDPDVHQVDGRWTMYLGGFSTTFRNRLYRATLAAGADLAAGPWVFDSTSRGRVAALLPDPPRRSWDSGGMHTPSWVAAVGDRPERIYYTGRATSRQFGPRSQYSIGMLERRTGSWTRWEGPLITGDGDRASALEPVVVHADGLYRMWYQANPHEIGPGDLPDYELRYTESENGIDWSAPVVFAGPDEGFFDNAVVRRGDEWLMVLARGANFHSTNDFPAQGLWFLKASTPSGDRRDWSEPTRLIDTDATGTPDWFGHGIYGPALAVPEPGAPAGVLFATGVRPTPRWPRMALRHLRNRRRPPIPSPFYLATGSIRMDLGG